MKCSAFRITYLEKMYTAGADYFAYQLYNLSGGVETASDVRVKVEAMREKVIDSGLGAGGLVITMPYYYQCVEVNGQSRQDCGFTSLHPSTENMSMYVSALMNYRYLDTLGGSYVYDFSGYDASSALPAGDAGYQSEGDIYVNAGDLAAYDDIYAEIPAMAALLVPDSRSIGVVDAEFRTLMESNGAVVDVVGAAEVRAQAVDLSQYHAIGCFSYGSQDSVASIDSQVVADLMDAVENGTTFVTNQEACGGAVLSLAGYSNAGDLGTWNPALRDSFFFANVPSDDPLFAGVETVTGDASAYSVGYWDSVDHESLIFRVDNTLSYGGRFGVLASGYLVAPDAYLASGFVTTWDVSPVRENWYPEWRRGEGRIVLTTGLDWTFDQATQRGGYVGVAGRKMLENLGAGLP